MLKKQSTTKTYIKQLLPFIGFWFPILSLATYKLINPSYSVNVIFTYCFITLLTFIASQALKWKAIYLVFLFLVTSIVSFLVFIDIGHFLIFKDQITASSIYIVFHTNSNESSEFMSMYLMRANILLIMFVHLVVPIVGFVFSYHAFPTRIFTRANQWVVRGFGIAIFTCGVLFLRNNKSDFLPHILINSYAEFQDELKELSRIQVTNNGDFRNVSHFSKSDTATYVVVIGESTTSTHMGLYGYYRPTTPLLNGIEDELSIFNSVRPPHTHTVASLGKALTLGNYDTPAKKFNSTIFQLFNSANFETYFISNQNPFGIHETAITLLSKASNHTVFTNTTGKVHDAAIITPLKEILKGKQRKKLIVIHLLGTHLEYIRRYPNEYDYFTDKPRTEFNHDKAYTYINQYDNAVLYNDYVVKSVIETVREQNSKSYVLYFSDHGEDVYETIDEACHTEGKGTEPMYKIPFILWQSAKYKTSKSDLVIKRDRLYNLEGLIHTLADLSDIRFEHFDATKSIVNSNYRES